MRIALPRIGHWRHDLGHCLQTTAGVLLAFHGADPLDVLGAAWGFDYRRGDVRREEYYFPHGPDRSLFEAMCPHHPVVSHWHEPADAETGWREVREAVLAGRPVAVTADNFHLPFRPAYRDVHTNHLLVVHGFDDRRGRVLVTDSVPPRFSGEIGLDELTAARNSTNPALRERDLFFTANPIGNRWLDVEVTGPMPAFDADRLWAVLTANRAGFLGPDDEPDHYRGLLGQHRFLVDASRRIDDDPDAVVDEVFVLAGVALATTGLHGDFLAAAGRRLRDGRLVELGRRVDRIAHHWSAIRIAVATARHHPEHAVRDLVERADRLRADQGRVLDDMRAPSGLSGISPTTAARSRHTAWTDQAAAAPVPVVGAGRPSASTPGVDVGVATACPECQGSVGIADGMMENETVECPECMSELEVVTIDPPLLARAPEVEEDWGE